uniref:Uncharacterized protein n=1 Tax=Periophthalmus magnuspinnatus TaxID=409849 RepID=A0A3B3ZD54_9GOBI
MLFSIIRKDLEERLSCYVLDTFSYIEAAKDFVNGLTNWILMRETELHLLLDIQDRAASVKQTDESEPRMLQFLKELEETAVQLDRMNKGARISSVTGSSVGAVGGILSIIGLALIPVTAGASLALTLTGVGLGITSGVNSAVTTATEIGVNRTQQKRASETFQKFMEDVSNLQDCLLEMIQQTVDGPIIHPTAGVAMCAGVAAAAAKAVAALPRVAAELPDVGQAAAKVPLALARGARGGFIALNALFLGMDVFFIVKDSMSLARGSETKASKFIRARLALWCSEMTSWQKIYKLLEKGKPSFKRKQAILVTEFYTEEEE